MLLWHLELPNKQQLDELKQQLADNMEVPQEIIDSFKTYPIEKVHPMAALRTAVSTKYIQWQHSVQLFLL